MWTCCSWMSRLVVVVTCSSWTWYTGLLSPAWRVGYLRRGLSIENIVWIKVRIPVLCYIHFILYYAVVIEFMSPRQPEEDLHTTSASTSLKCPITQKVIEIPIRGVMCRHIQVYTVVVIYSNNVCVMLSYCNCSALISDLSCTWIMKGKLGNVLFARKYIFLFYISNYWLSLFRELAVAVLNHVEVDGFIYKILQDTQKSRRVSTNDGL